MCFPGSICRQTGLPQGPKLGWLLLTLMLVGCSGESGPARVPVEGNAIAGGTPISRGSISFLPEAGHHGPAAMAAIEDGHFRLDDQNGPVAGPHRVIVSVETAEKAAVFASDGEGSRSRGPRRWTLHVRVPESGPFEYNPVLD